MAKGCKPRSLIGSGHNGYYDEHGNWQRTKFCFMSCGDRCDCGPPGGLYYSAEYDQRLKPPADGEAASDVIAAAPGGPQDARGDVGALAGFASHLAPDDDAMVQKLLKEQDNG